MTEAGSRGLYSLASVEEFIGDAGEDGIAVVQTDVV